MAFTSFINDSHEKISLEDGWTLTMFEKGKKTRQKQYQNLEAIVPGTVHQDLLRQDKIVDPFVSMNEKEVAWVAEYDWYYEKELEIPQKALDCDNCQLVFEGLDTFAEIYLDKKKIAETNNAFIMHRIDLPDNVKAGKHKLAILFRSPTKEIQCLSDKKGHAPCWDGGPRSWARKPQYSYGWDWGPILPTSGIFRPVYLQYWDDARINWYRYTYKPDDNGGILEVVVNVKSNFEGEIAVQGELFRRDEPIVRKTIVDSLNGCFEVILYFHLDDPELWWPCGFGDQTLYELTLILKKNNNEVHQTSEKIGLRTVELIQEDDQWGESFKFRVNGVEIYAMGANWIPDDSLLPRVDEKRYRRSMNMAVKANMNMLRVWGGGMYEDRKFYQIADEIGLMIWQDFPYACSFYPDDEEFHKLVEDESRKALQQYMRHPSIVIWCGNNEIKRDVKSFKERFNVSYMGRRIWEEIIPKVFIETNPGGIYWESSPMGGDFANDSKAGDRHVWEVWSFWQDSDDYLDIESRFISEFGFQSMPTRATIAAVVEPEHLEIQDEQVEWHNKQVWGPERLQRFLAADHKITTDFDNFVYLTQDVQGRALRRALEHWRRRRPKTMGSIIWQWNDCWPVASWSLIDYYNRPKASYYHVSRAFIPRTVALVGKGDNVELYAFNDMEQKWHADVRLTAMNFAGEILMSENYSSIVNYGAPNLLKSFNPKMWMKDPDKGFFVAEISMGSSASKRIRCGRACRRSVWKNRRFKHIELETPEISVKVTTNEGEAGIEVESKGVAFGVWFEDKKNNDLMFDDNALDLMPGDRRFIPTRNCQTGESMLAEEVTFWHIAFNQ